MNRKVAAGPREVPHLVVEGPRRRVARQQRVGRRVEAASCYYGGAAQHCGIDAVVDFALDSRRPRLLLYATGCQLSTAVSRRLAARTGGLAQLMNSNANV